jgi:methylated-DNA-[protein]-cysteine S-methyltransferase
LKNKMRMPDSDTIPPPIKEGELEYVTFLTEMGWVGILASAKGLLATTLPQPSVEETQRLLGSRVNQARQSLHWLADLKERLKAYFSHERVSFPDELDLSGATSFQKQVWQQTRLIPYGETRSYLWVAEQIKRPKAARAVGQALGRNPFPIIVPCHRVIASDGGLGGFSGGLEMKKRLLEMEGRLSP